MTPPNQGSAAPSVRTGQGSTRLTREEFGKRYRMQFYDPAFEGAEEEIARLTGIAWEAYEQGRKSPLTRKAGPGYADPDYDLSVEWLETRARIEKAAALWKDPSTASRVLLICGSARNDGSCPGEISKTFRMTQWAQEVLQQEKLETDVLDLSLLTSSYNLHIHPAKVASPPPCRCATGPAAAIPTMDWDKPATG